MSDLQSLFDKLDSALGDRTPWALKRMQGRVGRCWRVEARFADKDIAAENATPELAIRTVLGIVVEHALARAASKDTETRAAHDEVVRLHSIVGGA